MKDPEDQWKGDRLRADGLRIIEGLDGLVIMPREGAPLDRCPCCDKPFRQDERGLRGARMVADFCYPLATSAGH